MVLPSGVVIRAAEVGEAESVARLQLDCWEHAYTGLVPSGLVYERQGFRLDGRTNPEPEGLHLRMVRTLTP